MPRGIFPEMEMDASEGAAQSVEAKAEATVQYGIETEAVKNSIRKAIQSGCYCHPDSLPGDIKSTNYFGEGTGKDTL